MDNEGNKMQEKTNLGTKSYGYDNIYQLKSATYEQSQSFTWAYDDMGNRLSSNEDGNSKSYTPNNLNQYSAAGGNPYTYDDDGNLTNDGTRTYTWDKRNRLTGVSVSGSGVSVTYKYDHNDLRVERYDGTITTKYYYDGNLLLAESIDGKIQKVYINDGEGIIGMVRYIYDDTGGFSHYQPLYYLYDSLGSISMVTNEIGKPENSYQYSPFGSLINGEGDSVNALRFVGRYGGYADDDTGLIYFWHRWYDADDGRWVSRDPINTEGGINLYQYVFNIPTLLLDAQGLAVYKCCRNTRINFAADLLLKMTGQKHCFISTSTKAAGLGSKGCPKGLPSTPPVSKGTEVCDHSNDFGGGTRCYPEPDVDEECVNNAISIGSDGGKWGLTNNCNTYVGDIISKCSDNRCKPTPPLPKLRGFH